MDKQEAIDLLSAATQSFTPTPKADLLEAAQQFSIRECNGFIREWTAEASILRSQAHDLYQIAGYLADDVRRRAEALDKLKTTTTPG